MGECSSVSLSHSKLSLTRFRIDACSCVHLPFVLLIERVPWPIVQSEIIIILGVTVVEISYAQAEYAVPPALHGDDIPYYFPTSIGCVSVSRQRLYLHSHVHALLLVVHLQLSAT